MSCRCHISIGSVTTGGSSPLVTNSSTGSNAIFDFIIPRGPRGAAGATGGDTGPIGPTGPSPIGPAGDTGADTGPIGVDGPIGKRGPRGSQGLQGGSVTGPSGPAGFIGAVGVAGPAGITGPTGPTGALGPAGGVGPIGPAGAQGLAGPTGPQGITGGAGAVGPAGSQGPVGPTGTTGVAGATGPGGVVGLIGPTGEAPTGPAGPTGITGADGPTPTTQIILDGFTAGSSNTVIGAVEVNNVILNIPNNGYYANEWTLNFGTTNLIFEVSITFALDITGNTPNVIYIYLQPSSLGQPLSILLPSSNPIPIFSIQETAGIYRYSTSVIFTIPQGAYTLGYPTGFILYTNVDSPSPNPANQQYTIYIYNLTVTQLD
jgi:hypothetical protein